MISSAVIYLFTLALIATFFHILNTKKSFKFFKFIPAVVLIYGTSMLFATFGMFEQNEEIDGIYKLTKTNLLPAMLFLMLLEVDLKLFLKLGKSLVISYILAILSIAFGFIAVAIIFNFSKESAGAFGALAGSWMGGTANMIAVGSALEVSKEAFGYALIVDSINYTIWVALLLFLTPFANLFNKFTNANKNSINTLEVGCACNLGAPKYWFLISLALLASLISQVIAQVVVLLSQTTTIVLVSSILGVIGSFTRLKFINGSSEVSMSMLYMIIALIGSKAVLDNFDEVGIFILAGFIILLIHASIMMIGAKIFRLDLFSITVASLANIGGIASAPILAATYNKNLVSIGIVMAIMGYLIGTFGGLIVGNILIMLVQ